MNLAERGLLRGTGLFDKNRNKGLDRKQSDGSLKKKTDRLSVRAFSCIARFAWPVLFLTILVYCWLAVESLSYSHHAAVRHINSIQRLEDTTFKCPCQDDPNEMNNSNSDSHDNRANSTENKSDQQQQHVTLSNKNAANINKNGSYFTKQTDKHDYKYIHNPELLCKKNHEPQQFFLLIMVISAPENVARRDNIRLTYGNEKEWQAVLEHNSIVQYVFLLGKTNNETLQMDIDKEFDLHGDIVQEDFVDSLETLTKKTVMGLKWVTYHCLHATFVIKYDDASVIIQPKFYQTLTNAPTSKWAAGRVRLEAPVVRDINDEYYISKDFYAFPTYPPHLSGKGYILSTDLVEAIYKVAITTPLFPWEDVFIGMCLQKLNVAPTNINDFTTYVP